MFEPQSNRILSLGDLVGLSFRCFRSNLGVYVKVLGWPSLFASLASRFAVLTVQDWARIASSSQLAYEPFFTRMGLAFIFLIIWFVATWRLGVAACSLVRHFLGMEKDLKDSIDVMKKRAVPVLIAYNLAMLPPIFACLAWGGLTVGGVMFLPGVEPWRFLIGGFFFGFVGFGLTVTIALSSLYGSLLIAVTALESANTVNSLLRTWNFVRARPLRGGSFTCLIGIAVGAICFSIAGPLNILGLFEALSQSNMHLMAPSPLWFQALETMLDMILNVVSVALLSTGYGLFYRDLRLRLEGEDLLVRLSRLEQK